MEGRDRCLRDMGAEDFGVDWAFEDPGRVDAIMAQGSEEGHGIPVPERGVALDARRARTSSCRKHVFDMTPSGQVAPANPTSPRPGSGRLPEGDVGRLHHRRNVRHGPRTGGGPMARSTSGWRPATSAACSACKNRWPQSNCRRQACAAPPGPRSLLHIDEPRFVPPSGTGTEPLFELISQRCERGATLITGNLPFDEWTGTFGTGRLTGALPDRLTRHAHISEMNGDSCRPGQSRAPKAEPDT